MQSRYLEKTRPNNFTSILKLLYTWIIYLMNFTRNIFLWRVYIQHAPVNSAEMLEIMWFFQLLSTLFNKEVASISKYLKNGKPRCS